MSEQKAEAKASDSKSVMVKIRAVRPIMVERKVTRGVLEGRIVEAGTEVEVTEEDAKMFCDTQFKGHYAFGGERYSGIEPTEEDIKSKRFVSPFVVMGDPGRPLHDYRRAVRV